MIVCEQCRVVMRCERNEVGVDFGAFHVYPSDRFWCPKCNARVLHTNDRPVHDRGYRMHPEYVVMPEAEQHDVDSDRVHKRGEEPQKGRSS